MSVCGRSQHMSSRMLLEGSPETFFPTGKLIGSSRLLCCWLEASGGRRASQSQHKATSVGGRCHRLSARWSMLKGSLLSGEGNELEKPSTAKSALSPLGKKGKKQTKLQTVCNGITLICRGRAGGAALTVIYWVVSVNIWEWLESKCQLLDSGDGHKAGSGPGLAELQ